MIKKILILLIFSGTIFLSAAEIKIAPKFSLPNTENEVIHLDSILRKGPVYMSFWALWCKMCIKELDALKPYYDKIYKAKGLQVLAMSVDGPKSVARVKPFAKSHKWDYNVILDTEQKVKELYQVRAMPTAFIINQKGEIVYIHTGFKMGDEKMIVKELDKLFAETECESIPKTKETKKQ